MFTGPHESKYKVSPALNTLMSCSLKIFFFGEASNKKYQTHQISSDISLTISSRFRLKLCGLEL